MSRDRKARLAARRKKLEAERGDNRSADPSQNLNVAKGAPVTLGEVRAFALDGHPACRRRVGLAPDGSPCKCATRRFFRKNPHVIVDHEGNAWWPKLPE